MNRLSVETVVAVVLFAGGAVLFAGCEGPAGQPGRDVVGLDIVPPTIILTEPWPLSEVYDTLTVAASAVDNVDLREVVFFVDGSPVVNDQVLVDDDPPFAVHFSLVGFLRGWHFVSARAYDVADNVTDSPVVPVKVGFSSDLQDTVVTLRYHSGRVVSTWSLPDTSRTSVYWARFTVARACSLRSVSLLLSGNISDTAVVRIGVWSGGSLPSEEERFFAIESDSLCDSLGLHVVDFGGQGLRVSGNFFILISLEGIAEGDTVRIAADGGDPFWGRSGIQDEEGWHTLNQRFARRDNLMVTCEVYYAPTPGDENP